MNEAETKRGTPRVVVHRRRVGGSRVSEAFNVVSEGHSASWFRGLALWILFGLVLIMLATGLFAALNSAEANRRHHHEAPVHDCPLCGKTH